MDLIKILRSLEEFLYEAITWLLFYPRTLWRIVVRPLATCQYVHTELGQTEEKQFIDAIAPPLFLMLTVAAAHLFELWTKGTPSASNTVFGSAILANEQNLLVYRSIAFSIWPLVFASAALQQTRQPLNRNTLRNPFFAQCYLTAPFALGISAGLDLLHLAEPYFQLAGLFLFFAAFAWYMTVEIRWSHYQLKCGWLGATGFALLQFAVGCVINTIVTFCLFRA